MRVTLLFPGSPSPTPEEEWRIKELWEETLQALSSQKLLLWIE